VPTNNILLEPVEVLDEVPEVGGAESLAPGQRAVPAEEKGVGRHGDLLSPGTARDRVRGR